MSPLPGPVLRAHGVGHRFGDQPVLRGVDLEVGAGETVALLGASGSGKSTLLHCLAGVLVPDEGEIELDGVRLRSLDEPGRTALRARSCGFVLQFGRLVADLTAVENAALPLRLQGQPRRRAESRAREVLDEVGVGGLAERRIGGLSGGEQQRVAVARALVHRPPVIFADEPTGALDSANGDLVMDLLLGAARERGTTVVLVTHDDRLAQRADRRIRLADGRVETPTGGESMSPQAAHA